MRRLEIDLEEVAAALESSREMNEFFLDLATGEVVVIPAELLEQDWLEEDPADLPAWEQALLPVVREIQRGSERYARVPQVPSYEIYNLMVEFAETVTDRRLYQLLVTRCLTLNAGEGWHHLYSDKEVSAWSKRRLGSGESSRDQA